MSIDTRVLSRKTTQSKSVFGLKIYIGIAVIMTETVFLTLNAYQGLGVVLSSALVSLALLFQLRYGIKQDAASPADVAVFIFDWLFLDLAPKIQLISLPQQLVNTSSVRVDTVAMAFAACALFIFTFTAAYAVLWKRDAKKPASVSGPAQELFTPGGVGLALGVCLVTVAIGAPIAYRAIAAGEATQSPSSLILTKVLLFLPAAVLLIVLNETIRSGRKIVFSRVCVIGLLLVMVAITANPLTEKRNALGPLYLSLVLIGMQRWFSTSGRRLTLLVWAMVIAFPAISLFTHDKKSVGDVNLSILGDRISEYYASINYDAWANIYSSIEIVTTHGLQFGYQLLGSILFFVPSAIWATKPLATGIFIGNYLSINYGMWFTNLSAPLVAEGYLDFGFAGVFFYAGAVAYAVRLLNHLSMPSGRWVSSPIAVYFSMFLIFLLRGSFMVAMAYGSATLVSFWLASFFLGRKITVPRPAVVQHRGSIISRNRAPSQATLR